MLPGSLVLFYSILFYSILFYSILFYSILFYSILFYPIPFCSVLFCSVYVTYMSLGSARGCPGSTCISPVWLDRCTTHSLSFSFSLSLSHMIMFSRLKEFGSCTCQCRQF